MPFQEFKQWFEKETANTVKPLDREASELVEDIKKRISQVKEDSEKLIKESEKEIEKGKAYRRPRVTKKLAQFFIDTLNKTDFAGTVSFETTEALVKDLKKTFSALARERNMWFPRISPLFIMARRKLDMSFDRLFNSIEKLDSYTKEKYSRVRSVSEGFSTARTIGELQNELQKIAKEEGETRSAVSSLNRQIEEATQKILGIEQRDEMNELLQINSQAHELNRKAKYELRYLQKPLVKLQNLYHSGDASIPTDELEKLGEYLSRPFFALAKEDDGYPLLKKILHKVNDNMGNNKIKLKSSRQKKAQDQIETILNKAALTSLQSQCKQLYTRRRQLLNAGTIANLQNEATEIKTALKEHQRILGHLNSKLSALEGNHKEKRDRLEKYRKELEATAFTVTKKNVRLNV